MTGAAFAPELLPRHGSAPLAARVRLLFSAATAWRVASGGRMVSRVSVFECAAGGFAAAIVHETEDGVRLWRHAMRAPCAEDVLRALWAHTPVAIGVAGVPDCAALGAWRGLLLARLGAPRAAGSAAGRAS